MAHGGRYGAGTKYGEDLIEPVFDLGHGDVDHWVVPFDRGEIMNCKVGSIREHHKRNVHLGMRGVTPSLKEVFVGIHCPRSLGFDEPELMPEHCGSIIDLHALAA